MIGWIWKHCTRANKCGITEHEFEKCRNAISFSHSYFSLPRDFTPWHYILLCILSLVGNLCCKWFSLILDVRFTLILSFTYLFIYHYSFILSARIFFCLPYNSYPQITARELERIARMNTGATIPNPTATGKCPIITNNKEQDRNKTVCSISMTIA